MSRRLPKYLTLKKTSSVCVLVSFLICLFSPIKAVAASKEENVLKTISEFIGRREQDQRAKISELSRRFEIASGDSEKRLAALALGVYYLGDEGSSGSAKLAYQYLNIAESVTTPGDNILPIIKFYKARARFGAGAYQEAIEDIRGLLRGQLGPGWEKGAFGLLMESVFRVRDFEALLAIYTEYNKRFTPSRREQEVIQLAAISMEKKGAHEKVIETLEELALLYPMSSPARWAFNKLLEFSCAKKDRYFWSRELLLRLSRNTTLDSGLREFIAATVEGPIRVSAHEVRQLDLGEKIEFLIRARFYDEALPLAEKIVEENTTDRSNRSFRIRGLLQMGRIYQGLSEHELAARYFSLFIEEFPTLQDSYRARELLAESLMRLKLYRPAAAEYAILAQNKGISDPLLRWQHFWNTYLAHDYEDALRLLDRPGYVPPRDTNEPSGLEYWRGRILEQLGRQGEADKIYRDILVREGDGFYAQMVLARKPAYIEAENNFGGSPPGIDNGMFDLERSPALNGAKNAETAEISNRPDVVGSATASPEVVGFGEYEPEGSLEERTRRFGLSAKLSPNSKISSKTNAPLGLAPAPLAQVALDPALRTVDELIQTGLFEAAKIQLRGIAWQDYRGEESYAVVSRLSWLLNDYRPSLGSPFRAGSALKSKPRAFWAILDHQKKFNSDWRVFFPLAYGPIVSKISDQLNISPYFVLSIMRAESHYNMDARSPVGAMGLMQIMPYTGIKLAQLLHDHRFEVVDLKEPEINVAYGAYYLKKLVNYYGGNYLLATASYNAGPVAVNNWVDACAGQGIDEFVEFIPYRETRRYVKNVLRNFNFYSRIYEEKNALVKLPEIPTYLPEGEEVF